MRFISIPHINFGCDPEMFFERGGRVIGAEKVLPTVGNLAAHSNYGEGTPKAIVLDGVQVEFNPNPGPCRANLGVEIASAFRALRAHLKSMPDVKCSFKTTVDVEPDELASLAPATRILGCQPSLNLYDPGAIVSVNAATYTKRSAGGHIHLGLDATTFKNREVLVAIMDIIVGNTCVLVDRDPTAALRREVYGRAGEHRLPKHGLEYRTLSNFWLRNYRLFGLVMGLARLAVGIVHTSHTGKAPINLEKDLLDRIDIQAVTKAINTNDFDLARANFEIVKGFLTDGIEGFYECGLTPLHLSAFDHFVDVVKEKGIEKWFPEDPIEHWCRIFDGHGNGWESFLARDVTTSMQAAKGLPAPPAPEPPKAQTVPVVIQSVETVEAKSISF